jgi:C4-type Zn-finger protein
MKHITACCLAAALLFGGVAAVQADEADLKQQVAAIDKELAPMKKKATADPDVKAAQEAVKAAQAKYNDAVEAAMIRADPKAKELLDKRKALSDQMAAARKASKGSGKGK